MNRTIETDRLILRPLTVSDAAEAFTWLGDPLVNQYMSYSVYESVRQVEEWISSLQEDSNMFGFYSKGAHKLIGSGAISYSPADNAYLPGYNLSREFWGCGYATEAVKAMIQWAYKELQARDFAVSHANENEASRRVILKCGFVFDHYGQYAKSDGSATFDASFYTMHMEG